MFVHLTSHFPSDKTSYIDQTTPPLPPNPEYLFCTHTYPKNYQLMYRTTDYHFTSYQLLLPKVTPYSARGATHSSYSSPTLRRYPEKMPEPKPDGQDPFCPIGT